MDAVLPFFPVVPDNRTNRIQCLKSPVCPGRLNRRFTELVDPFENPQLLDLIVNAADDPRPSPAEGELVEDSLEDFIVRMQDSVRAKPDDVFSQLIPVVVDRSELRYRGFGPFLFGGNGGGFFGFQGWSWFYSSWVFLVGIEGFLDGLHRQKHLGLFAPEPFGRPDAVKLPTQSF